MNKESIISNFAAGLAVLILGGISLHFIPSDYTLLVGFVGGVGHGHLVPLAKKLIFKK